MLGSSSALLRFSTISLMDEMVPFLGSRSVYCLIAYPCAFFRTAAWARRGSHLEVTADEELASHVGQWCIWVKLVEGCIMKRDCSSSMAREKVKG